MSDKYTIKCSHEGCGRQKVYSSAAQAEKLGWLIQGFGGSMTACPECQAGMEPLKGGGERKPRLAFAHSRFLPRICPELADELGKLLQTIEKDKEKGPARNGLNESIVLLQIDYLISISTSPKQRGDQWTYQSLRKLQGDYFPFWSVDTIGRALKNLEALGLIETDSFNKKSYDRTRWYRIRWARVRKLKSVNVMQEYSYTAEEQDPVR